MLERCLNLSLKRFKKIYLITEDYSIKTKYKKKVILSKLREIKKIRPDYLLSVLNDKILTNNHMKYVKKNSINFHDGPLPRYAGVFSSSWAVYNREKKYGVCWHKIEKGIDTGDILIEKKFDIKNDFTAFQIDAKSVEVGINLFKKIIKLIKKNSFKFKKQNFQRRTYNSKKDLKKLYKKFINDKHDIILRRAFTLSDDKKLLLERYFKMKINLENILSSQKLDFKKIDKVKIKKLVIFINKILKTNFSFNKENLSSINKFALNAHPKWDSLAHVKLLSAFEKKFKISVDEKNIGNFSNLEKIFQFLYQKLYP